MEKLFDSDLVRRHRLRAQMEAAPGADFLMRHVCDDLAERLSTVERRFARAADLFSGSSLPTAALAVGGKVGEVVAVESDRAFLRERSGLLAPPETLPLEPESIDLAVALLSVSAEVGWAWLIPLAIAPVGFTVADHFMKRSAHPAAWIAAA